MQDITTFVVCAAIIAVPNQPSKRCQIHPNCAKCDMNNCIPIICIKYTSNKRSTKALLMKLHCENHNHRNYCLTF